MSIAAALPKKTRRLFELSNRVKRELDPVFSLDAMRRLLEVVAGLVPHRSGKIRASAKIPQDMSVSWVVGQRIRAARLSKGWTQLDLADRSGILRANVARLEAGRHAPSVETVAVVADALSLSLAELFETFRAADKLRGLNERQTQAGTASLRTDLQALRRKGIIDKNGDRVRRELPTEMLEGTSEAV